MIRIASALLMAGTVLSPAFAATESKPVAMQSLAGSYLAARVAVADRDTQNAVEYYSRAMELDPDNSKLREEAFLIFLANGDFADGIELAKRIDADGAPDVLHLVLAVDALRAKKPPEALKQLDREWTGALDTLIAGLVSGWAHMSAGEVDKALAAIDALDGPPWFDLFTAYHSGLIALQADRSEEALERLGAAVANVDGGRGAPATYPRAVRAYAVALARAGDFDKAMETVGTEAAQRPNALFESVLEALSEKRIPPLGVSSPQRGAAEVFLNIGSAINRPGGGEQFAGIYFHLAKALAPKMDAVSITLGDYFDRTERLDRANENFATVPPASPFARIARLEKALNLDELEKLDEARAIMDKLLAEDPDDLVTTLSYGAVLARHEKYAEAAEIYEAAIGRIDDPKPIHWNLFYRVGMAYERTKRWPEAEASFRRALELFPDEPRVLNYLGYSLVDMNMKLDEGLDMIRKAVRQRPNDGYIVDSLGWA